MFRIMLLPLALLWSCASAAGVIIGGTRVVYDASRSESAISVKSPASDEGPFLVQSWIDNQSGENAQAAFVITPPLFRLDAGQENVLRIIRTQDDLPGDRESLFWLNIKAIPASRKSDANQLLISVKSRMKLIYRPSGLPGSPGEAYRKLRFHRQGRTIRVDNPTAYYVSLLDVRLDSEALERKFAITVAPFASSDFPLPETRKSVRQVRWSAVNDYGGATGEMHQDL